MEKAKEKIKVRDIPAKVLNLIHPSNVTWLSGAEDHMNTDAETAELVHFQTEQIARLSALVRTLLEMSNLQAVPRR